MNPTPTPPLTYVKLAIVALALVGGFVLCALGKIDASSMFDKTSTMIGALVVALGISGAGAAIAGKLASTSPSSPVDSKSSQRGFSAYGVLVGVSFGALGAAVLAACLSACTPQQAVNVENAVFTSADVACIAANSGLLGNSTAVQDIMNACQIAPALQGPVTQLVNDFVTAKAAQLHAPSTVDGGGSR